MVVTLNTLFPMMKKNIEGSGNLDRFIRFESFTGAFTQAIRSRNRISGNVCVLLVLVYFFSPCLIMTLNVHQELLNMNQCIKKST